MEICMTAMSKCQTRARLCWMDYDFERHCLCGVSVPLPLRLLIFWLYDRQTLRRGRRPYLGEPIFTL